MMNPLKTLSTKPLLVGAVAAGALQIGGMAYAAETVTVAEFKYPSAQATLHVVKQILEQKLGIQVEKLPGNNAVFYAGMDRGKGEVDFHVEVWLPNQIELVKEYRDEKGTIKVSGNPYAATSGFCVPRYFAEANNIKTIDDLARPEIAAQLDSDGDGMGEIWVGKPGWIATNENSIKVRDYGLLAFSNETRHDAAVHYGNLAAAVKKKEGYAGYCWKPDGVWKQYDVVQLEEPPHADECHNQIRQQDDPDWFENSSITCASAPKAVHIAWATALEDRLPVVASFLGNIQLDTDTVSAWAYEVGSLKRDPADVAAAWIAANPEKVDAWLGL